MALAVVLVLARFAKNDDVNFPREIRVIPKDTGKLCVWERGIPFSQMKFHYNFDLSVG